MNGMDQIYLHFDLVVNNCIGRKSKKEGQILKPLTLLKSLATNTTNNHKGG